MWLMCARGCGQADVARIRAARRRRGHDEGVFDVIVGTDVVFAERCVEPLLRSIHALSGESTTVWLCLQVRAQGRSDSQSSFAVGERGALASYASPAGCGV